MKAALESCAAALPDKQIRKEVDQTPSRFKRIVAVNALIAAILFAIATVVYLRTPQLFSKPPIVLPADNASMDPAKKETETPLSEQPMPDAGVADSSDKALQEIVSVHVTMNKNSDTSPQKLIFKDESFSTLEPISRDGRVQTIDFSRSFFPPHSLRYLDGLKYLERLDLGYVRLYNGKEPPVPLSSSEVAELKNLPRLRELIFCKAALNADAFSAIAQLHALRDLFVVRCQVTDEALSRLSASNLEKISVDDNLTLHGGGFRALNSLQEVEAVQISLDDQGAHCLFALPNLTQLNIINSTQQCKNLPFELLSTTGKISNLQVSGMQASDLEGIGKIKSLRQLAVQQYQKDNLQDKDLLALKNLKNLKSLLLCDFRNITDGGISKLKRLLPDCNVSAVTDPKRGKE